MRGRTFPGLRAVPLMRDQKQRGFCSGMAQDAVKGRRGILPRSASSRFWRKEAGSLFYVRRGILPRVFILECGGNQAGLLISRVAAMPTVSPLRLAAARHREMK